MENTIRGVLELEKTGENVTVIRRMLETLRETDNPKMLKELGKIIQNGKK